MSVEAGPAAGSVGPAARGRWPAVLAWALWALAMGGIVLVLWFDHLLRESGRSDLLQFTASAAPPELRPADRPGSRSLRLRASARPAAPGACELTRHGLQCPDDTDLWSLR